MNHPMIAGVEAPALTRAALEINEVADALTEAQASIPTLTTGYEGYAVILEQLDGVWHQVKHGTREQARQYAEQVAVHALRYMIDLTGGSYHSALNAVAEELTAAMRKFGPMASGHEGYAVIKEELDELWYEVCQGTRDTQRAEVLQVAAMAIRFLVDIPEEIPGETIEVAVDIPEGMTVEVRA
jgi:hypothetical protein